MSAFEPFTFVHITDHHIGTPRSYRFRPAINRRWAAIKQQLAQTGADLLLVGGDLTRDGDTHEYEYQLAREDLDTLPFPVFVIPGNMDVGNKHTRRQGPYNDRDDVLLNVTSHRLQLFASYFGPIQWSFLHKEVRFTGFYAAVAGSGLPEEQRFWRFMERLPGLPRGRFHVAIMHYWLYMEDLDEPNWDITKREQYHNWYFSIDQPHRRRIFEAIKAAGVNALFCGHVHTGRPVESEGEPKAPQGAQGAPLRVVEPSVRIDGVRIYRTPAAGNTPQLVERWRDAETRFGFQLCRVTERGLDVRFVPGADQCAESEGEPLAPQGAPGAPLRFDSYGPGGHPKLQDRDYSLAREKPPLAPDPWLARPQRS